MKNLVVLFLSIISLAFTHSEAKELSPASKYVGTWTYECNEAPYPYHEGSLVITEKDNKTLVKVIFDDGDSATGRNVEIKEGKLSFEIWVEGNSVKTVLEQQGTKYIGKVNSPEGQMNLKLEKKAAK